MRSRIMLGALFGVVGGFLGFLLQEALVPHLVGHGNTSEDSRLLGFLIGSCIGLGIGIVEGAAVSNPRKVLIGGILGAVIGGFGGILGAYVGGGVYGVVLFGQNPDVPAPSPLAYAHLAIARALAWTFLGAFPGMAAGASTFSAKRARYGLIGGLLGGFIGGLVFNLVADLIVAPVQGSVTNNQQPVEQEIGGLSRAIGITTIGLLTGLFINLVEEFFKQGWVKVLAGANEGKDYILSKTRSIIGRSELADVPIFGDSAIAPSHAAIQLEQGRHFLVDSGSAIGSLVNGQRVSKQILRDGDMIQIGQARLLFREKATAGRISHPLQDAPAPAASGGVNVPVGVCPYCGAMKDVRGNCMCSVPDGGVIANNSPTFSTPPQTNFQPDYPSAQAGPVGSLRLSVVDGPCAGQVFPLTAANYIIGREPGCDISLPADSTVSRKHAHICLENGRYILYDDGSSNGTSVNRIRVNSQPIKPGDVIQLGTTILQVEV